MLLLWKEDIPYWKIALGYAFVGIGVGFAGTPASHSLTGSVPVHRAGMASGTADLQRDLGGAIMQSILGALLTAGYAAAMTAAIGAAGKNVTDARPRQSSRSRSRARRLAKQYPQYADPDHAAAKTSFLQGDQWAYSRRYRRDRPGCGARLLPASRRRKRRSGCSPSTTRRTQTRPGFGHDS